jgi:hypothetical protein
MRFFCKSPAPVTVTRSIARTTRIVPSSRLALPQANSSNVEAPQPAGDRDHHSRTNIGAFRERPQISVDGTNVKRARIFVRSKRGACFRRYRR